MANSWILGAHLFRHEGLAPAGPAGYEPRAEIRELVTRLGGTFHYTPDPFEAVAGADPRLHRCLDQHGAGERGGRTPPPHDALSSQLAAVRHGQADALFMHCLPAHAGEEVTQEVLDLPRCVIFDERKTGCTCRRRFWRC